MRETAIIITATDLQNIRISVEQRHSALREAEHQEQRAGERHDKAREVTARRRLELGRALVEARKAWPARGPKAKGWGEFLERVGIEQDAALRMMHLAGYVEAREVSRTDDAVREIPTVREVNAARREPAPAPFAATSPDAPDLPGAPLTVRFDPDVVDADQDEDDEAAAPPVAPDRPVLDIRLGRWQEALADVGHVDAIICDPPYSARTHAAKTTRRDGVDAEGLAPVYAGWTEQDVRDFVEAWSGRCRGWIVALTDSELIGAWRDAYRAAGRYAFAPVPCVITGMSVRMAGDGPSSWAVYAMVSRPTELSGWGTLPGAYVGPAQPGAGGGRGKPLWLMESIVRDYSRGGDLVCDPFAGWGSTLIAARKEGRRGVGAELEADAIAEAQRRAIDRGLGS